jgi:predicted SprT family Zn-dependent metalloprotease
VLEALFLELNQVHFSGELPIPLLRWNSRLSTSAGRFCPGSRNPLFPRSPEIEVATYLKGLPDGTHHIRDTMLHEMVHYFLWHRRRPYGHNQEFHQILKKVGARRYNPVPKLRAVKHWYRCPSCGVLVPARRKIANSACAPCCKKFNRGYYSDKFKLYAVPAPAPPPAATASLAPKPTAQAPAPTEKEVWVEPQEVIRRLEELKRMIRRR